VLPGTCVAGNYYPNLSPLENEPPMKALFLGTLAASQATPIIEFITADVRTEILDNDEPAQAAAALADADVLLTGAWRSGFPAAPKLRLLQVPLARTDGIDVSSLPRGVTLCNAYGHEPALGTVLWHSCWDSQMHPVACLHHQPIDEPVPVVGGVHRHALDLCLIRGLRAPESRADH
jgi:hypothetical protein